MDKREQVINDLVEHIESALAIDSDYVDCVRTDLLQYAVALLKEQEPRLLTLEEWENAQEPLDGECMCYEIKKYGLKAMLVKVYKGCKELYGKEFRCWTSRPTDEQRKAAAWER